MLTALPPKDYHSDTAAVVVDDDDDSGYPKMMRRRGGVGRINNSQWPRTATKAQLQWQNRYRYIIKIYIIVYFRPSLFRTAARSLLRHPVAPVRTVQNDTRNSAPAIATGVLLSLQAGVIPSDEGSKQRAMNE